MIAVRRGPRPTVHGLPRVIIAGAIAAAACGGAGSRHASPTAAPAQSLVLITIDTLRADRLGAYGYAAAHTPSMDQVAREGVRFTRALTTAPITLPAHASLLSGRYPPGHGARHNGIAMTTSVPTLATVLQTAGFATAAFVSAFPLDRRFGLTRGFDVYDDELPRGPDRKLLNERQGVETARRAVSWLGAKASERFFLWVHLFEPHAPYGDPQDTRPVSARYDEEIAESDRAVAELLGALGARAASTLVVIAADHGEAFGEHGETGHSVFVYDTTLRIPLLMRGPGVPPGRSVDDPVTLVDVAPTVIALLGMAPFDADGVTLQPALTQGTVGARMIYAESFAPLLDFGWSPLRTVREGPWKYIAAPRPELYALDRDPGETTNLESHDPQRASRLLAGVQGYSGVEPNAPSVSADAANRLRSLGYLGSGSAQPTSAARPDPKDRIHVASRLAEVTSGEARGDRLFRTLEAILEDDPANPQAHLRLGYAEIERGRCDRAEPHLRTALAARLPSADAGLALADCRRRANDIAGAVAVLEAARALEPGNPVVEANLGLMALAGNDTATAIRWLQSALEKDPTLLEARFALARALGRAGRRADAAAQARVLLAQLPPDAPQRHEVQRLLEALR